MIVSKKSIGLIVLFLIPRFAIGQNSVDSIVAKQESCMAIRTDSLCCSRSVCNCDTVQQDSCLQQHGLSLISKDQKMTRDINPNALKMRKFNPMYFQDDKSLSCFLHLDGRFPVALLRLYFRAGHPIQSYNIGYRKPSVAVSNFCRPTLRRQEREVGYMA